MVIIERLHLNVFIMEKHKAFVCNHINRKSEILTIVKKKKKKGCLF